MMDQYGRSSCSARRTRGRYKRPMAPRLTHEVDLPVDECGQLRLPAASSAWTDLTNWRGRRAGITVYSEATPTVTITEVKMAAKPRISVGHCGLPFARV